MRRATSRSASRRGGLSLEFLFLFPIFLGLVVAFVEFATAVRCEEKLCVASHAGCKAASRGATREQIEAACRFNLGIGTLECNSTIEICQIVHSHHGERLVPVARPELLPPGTPIVVTVEAPAAAVTPNFLRAIGFDLCGEQLSGQTTLLKE
jgi:hypothetical protein